MDFAGMDFHLEERTTRSMPTQLPPWAAFHMSRVHEKTESLRTCSWLVRRFEEALPEISLAMEFECLRSRIS